MELSAAEHDDDQPTGLTKVLACAVFLGCLAAALIVAAALALPGDPLHLHPHAGPVTRFELPKAVAAPGFSDLYGPSDLRAEQPSPAIG